VNPFAIAAMFFVGATLGLLGSGGSVLTVPILFYGLDLGMHQATGYSLLVVGVTSAFGALSNWRRGTVSLWIAAWFAVPSLISVYWTRAVLVPRLPAGSDRVLMAAFAVLMIAAAIAMIRRGAPDADPPESQCRCPVLMAEGFVVGILAGLFGAGGGFLIVPALVLVGRLPMRLAVGTSLTIISVQSLIGFVGTYRSGMAIDWTLLGVVTGTAIIGMLVGLLLSPRVAAHHLRAAFGWFLLVAGVAIATRELLNPSH